jgi:class 3 adenylate cyclase
MSIRDEVSKYVHDTFHSVWEVDDSDRVPTEEDAIGLGNQGKSIDATVFYADLTDSTGLVNSQSEQFAAEVYKAYVYAAAKCIRQDGGSVTAYDGDRVMGVFVEGAQRNNAVRAAFRVSAVVEDILQPELDAMYGASQYKIQQKVGMDHSSLLVANTGIRGNNDYVWVGKAANNAAKMAALKRGYNTYATDDVHSGLLDNLLKASGTSDDLWVDLGSGDLGYKIWGGFGRMVHI